MEKKYTETIGRLQTERRKRKKKSQFLLSLKLVSFLAMAAFIYGACTMPYVLLFSALALISAAVYVFALIRDGRCIRDMERMDALIKACQNELGYLRGDFRAFDDGARYASPEHEFAYDLDIFGRDSLFQRINRTRTEEGSDRLARKLSVLETDIETIKANQQAINDLSGRFDWRLRFMAGEQVQSKFVQLCREMSSKSLSNAPVSPVGKIQHLIPYASSALTLLALLGYICDWWPGVWFSLLFFIQLAVCIIRGKKMQHTILATDKLHHEFKGYLDLLREIQQEPFQAEALKHLQKQLFEGPENSIRAFRQLTRLQNLFDQRSNALMYVVLNGLFLYDLLLQRKFDEWMTRYLPHVEMWVDQVSEFDALVSLGNYAANNPNNTIPQILTEATDPVIRACDTYHPFLAHKQPVTNSFTLDKKRIAIVTGANMAGKSTFLRTIGVNYIFWPPPEHRSVPVSSVSPSYRSSPACAPPTICRATSPISTPNCSA